MTTYDPLPSLEMTRSRRSRSEARDHKRALAYPKPALIFSNQCAFAVTLDVLGQLGFECRG